MVDKIQKHRNRLNQESSPLPDLTDLRVFVSFIGFSRSGHSFIGQIINAHPDALIGNEGKMFDVLENRLTLENVCRYLLMLDGRFAEREYRKRNGQDFHFAGLSQGKIRNIKCLGNSKAGYTSSVLHGNNEILFVMQEIIPVPVKFVLVVRDPRDLVGSEMKRRGDDFESAFNKRKEDSRKLGQLLPVLHAKFKVLEIVYEEFIDDLPGGIGRLFSFLSLDIPNGFVEAVQAKTYRSPEKSRVIFNDVDGAEKLFDELISTYSFFEPYQR